MSIFVNEEDTFSLSVKFSYIYHQGKVVGAKVLSDQSPTGNGVHELVCDCAARDAKNMSHIRESSIAVNLANGKETYRLGPLYKQVILRFFKAWNAVEVVGEGDNAQRVPIPINSETVDALRDSIQQALARKYLRITSGKEINPC